MPERPDDPAPSEQFRRVASGQAHALVWVAVVFVALGSSFAVFAPTIAERVIATTFAILGVLGLGLGLRARTWAACWTLILALLGASVSAATVSEVGGSGLMLLGLVPIMAGSMLERREMLVSSSAAIVVALVALLVEPSSIVAVTIAILAIGSSVVVVDHVVVRQRSALARVRLDNAVLERAQDRQVDDEQDRTNLERAVAQAQRLESLGRLAGSVAHDFNNMLAGIRGNLEVASLVEDREQIREQLETANLLIDRAAILTRNLLRFAKGQPAEVGIVDINELLRSSEPIYHSLVGAHIKLRIELGATRSRVPFSPAQFEQLLLNLVVNASDAMPHGGELCIGTWDLDDGRVELFVSDTGQGMSESIQVMIFQPYFTTKGKGTGIGLATVHEIVETAGGEIRVDSIVNQGTRFCVLLPIAGG